jgi:sterol 24-C-methyltransferase
MVSFLFYFLGISQLHSVQECLDALKSVGFEIVEYEDLAEPKLPLVKSAQVPWHTPLKGSYELSLDAISRWKMNPIGRVITDTFVWVLETLRLAPPGTRKISQMLK